jgi:thiosulfate reductase cytochrome b subunit
MSLTSKPDSPHPHPADPKPDLHPLVVLSLAVSLAVATGLLAGWPAGVSVLVAVLGLFARSRTGSDE